MPKKLTKQEYLEQLTDDYIDDLILEDGSLMTVIRAVIRSDEIDALSYIPKKTNWTERSLARTIFNKAIAIRDAEVDW